jgi:hypothetical protein
MVICLKMSALKPAQLRKRIVLMLSHPLSADKPSRSASRRG